MIKKNTVLVLGAGSSIGYGFPSGRQLTNGIVEALGGGATEVAAVLQALGHSTDEMTGFREALRLSGKASVDAFLEHRPEFVNVGKAAIAATLIPFERPQALFPGTEHWYEHLFNKLSGTLAEFATNRLTIVTFNYDRSLETYLHTCLSHAFGLDDANAAAALEAIPIIHVHGVLGDLAWQPTPTNVRPYGPELTPETVRAGASTIRIVHEAGYDDSEFVRARTALTQAEWIVFLGFGYLQQNVERLGVSGGTGATLFGTSFGLTRLELTTIRGLFGRDIDFGAQHYTVLEFLRERVALE